MIKTLSDTLSRFAHRWVPDPLILSILLTFLTLALAFMVGSQGPAELLLSWGGGGGVWKLLAFSMQMCLILVTGHALGVSPPVRRAISALAGWPQSAQRAVVMTSLIAMLAGLVNWGFGLIVGALLAREVGRSCSARGLKVHYPLLGAAGYAGMLVWHGGLSGSALGFSSPLPPFTSAVLLPRLLSAVAIVIIGTLLLFPFFVPLFLDVLQADELLHFRLLGRVWFCVVVRSPLRHPHLAGAFVPPCLEGFHFFSRESCHRNTFACKLEFAAAREC